MLNSELRKQLEDQLIETAVSKAPDIVAAALATLADEYKAKGFPLVAAVQHLCAVWAHAVGLKHGRQYILQLVAALDHGDFTKVNLIDAVKRAALHDQWRKANSADRVLALRWAAWLGSGFGASYKVLGRALLGMEVET